MAMEIAWGARLVNIRIHQFRDGGAVVDAAALEQFQQQWATYQKLVDSDCLSHKAVGRPSRRGSDTRLCAAVSDPRHCLR